MPLLITVPDISDADLVLDENEARGVLKMFWPQRASKIDEIPIGNAAKRLAQAALMAAIDATYSMGYINAVFNSYLRPAANVQSAIKRVAKGVAKHWWKHAKPQDLMDAKVYDAVVKRIALNLRSRMDDLAEGLVSRRAPVAFFA
jgi:hypothetical protein